MELLPRPSWNRLYLHTKFPTCTLSSKKRERFLYKIKFSWPINLLNVIYVIELRNQTRHAALHTSNNPMPLMGMPRLELVCELSFHERKKKIRKIRREKKRHCKRSSQFQTCMSATWEAGTASKTSVNESSHNRLQLAESIAEECWCG